MVNGVVASLLLLNHKGAEYQCVLCFVQLKRPWTFKCQSYDKPPQQKLKYFHSAIVIAPILLYPLLGCRRDSWHAKSSPHSGFIKRNKFSPNSESSALRILQLTFVWLLNTPGGMKLNHSAISLFITWRGDSYVVCVWN